MFDSVSKRFFTEMLKDESNRRTGIKMILCHRLFNHDKYSETFVNVLEGKLIQDTNTEQFTNASIFTQIFLVACEVNRVDIVKIISGFNVPITILNQGFKDSCYNNNMEVTEMLIPFVSNISESFLHACSFGCLKAIRVLMLYRYVMPQSVYTRTRINQSRATIIITNDVDNFERILQETINLPPLLLHVFLKMKSLVQHFVNLYPVSTFPTICMKTGRLSEEAGIGYIRKLLPFGRVHRVHRLLNVSQAISWVSSKNIQDVKLKASLLYNLKLIVKCMQYDKLILIICGITDMEELDLCTIRDKFVSINVEVIPSDDVINDILQPVLHVLKTLSKDERKYFKQILSWTTEYSKESSKAVICSTDLLHGIFSKHFQDMFPKPVYICIGQTGISFDDLKEGLYRSCKAGHDAASSLIIDVFLHFHEQEFTKHHHIDSTADYTSITNYSIMTRAITETIDIGNYQFALKLTTNYQRMLRSNDIYIICVHYCYENQTSYAERLLRKLNALQEDVLAGLLIEHMTCRPLIDTVLRVCSSTFHTPDKFRNITPKEYAKKYLSSNGKYILDLLESYEQQCSQNADNL